MRRFALLLVLACVVTLPAVAQDRPGTAIEGQIDVTEVFLDVLVTDPSGNVIVGLTEDDFQVEEEGEPIDLTGATFYSNRRFVDTLERAEGLGVDTDDIPVNRFFILFYHDRRQDLPEFIPQLMDAARFSKRWVDEELLVNDYVAVVSYDYKLKIYQDFTTDKKRIKKAIDKVPTARGEIENWPSRREAAPGPSLLANLPEGHSLDRKTWEFHHGLRYLAEAAGSIVGRKNLLLFSPGFGPVNEFNTYTPDMRWYPGMMEELNDSNVAVYSIDLIPSVDGGLNPNRTLPDSLSLVSSDTGGYYYVNFNTYATPLKLVEEDNNGYYLLSYTSTYPASESGYRKVSVSTKNKGFKVRSRGGYLYGQL